MSIIIPSNSFLESEANAAVTAAIARAWANILGDEKVSQVNIRAAASVISCRRPKVVMLVGSYLPHSSYYEEISAACRSVGATSVYWATEDPYEIDANYHVDGLFDLVCTCEKGATRRYTRSKAIHLPLGALIDESFREINGERKDIDLFFCGVAFINRKELLGPLAEFIDGLNAKIIGPGWEGLGSSFSGQRLARAELFEYYSRSKITLNIGRSLHFENKQGILLPSTPGPRTFEAALCGTTQMFFEDTSELDEYFNRQEIVRFSSRSELRHGIEQLLSSPDAADGFARRAQKRACAHHTYEKRLLRLVSVLKGMGQIHDSL